MKKLEKDTKSKKKSGKKKDIWKTDDVESRIYPAPVPTYSPRCGDTYWKVKV